MLHGSNLAREVRARRLLSMEEAGRPKGAFTRKLFGDFFAFESSLRDGVFIAAVKSNTDGFSDIIASAGLGGSREPVGSHCRQPDAYHCWHHWQPGHGYAEYAVLGNR